MPIKDIAIFGWRKLVMDVTNVNQSLRHFASTRGMLVEDADALSKGGIMGWLMQLIFPIFAFGFLFGTRSGHPALSLLVGAACTAVLFVLARVIQNVVYGLETKLGDKPAFLPWFALLAVFLTAFVAAPVVVLTGAAFIAPTYVSPMAIGSAITSGLAILSGDTILGCLTGVRLFVEKRSRAKAKADTK